MNGKKSENWKRSMEKEMKSLLDNKTWKLVKKPDKQRVVQCKSVYKLKESSNPSDPLRYKASSDPLRYKARLVAKGFTQRQN